MKKLAIGALVLAVALIVTGNSILVYNMMQKEKIDLKKVSASIKKDYNAFKKDIETFNEQKIEYEDKVAANLFLETIEEYDDWIKVIDSYTETIKKIEKDSKELREMCINKTYTDEATKNKCNAFIVAYEESINSYVKDINGFNEEVSNIRVNLKKSEKEHITEYELKYEYIDINSDGITEGVE